MEMDMLSKEDLVRKYTRKQIEENVKERCAKLSKHEVLGALADAEWEVSILKEQYEKIDVINLGGDDFVTLSGNPMLKKVTSLFAHLRSLDGLNQNLDYLNSEQGSKEDREKYFEKTQSSKEVRVQSLNEELAKFDDSALESVFSSLNLTVKTIEHEIRNRVHRRIANRNLPFN